MSESCARLILLGLFLLFTEAQMKQPISIKIADSKAFHFCQAINQAQG